MTTPESTAPLDLRAVDARYKAHQESDIIEEADRANASVQDVPALVAHCRVLRTALRKAFPIVRSWDFVEDNPLLSEEIAAVLAQAQDETA